MRQSKQDTRGRKHNSLTNFRDWHEHDELRPRLLTGGQDAAVNAKRRELKVKAEHIFTSTSKHEAHTLTATTIDECSPYERLNQEVGVPDETNMYMKKTVAVGRNAVANKYAGLHRRDEQASKIQHDRIFLLLLFLSAFPHAAYRSFR